MASRGDKWRVKAKDGYAQEVMANRDEVTVRRGEVMASRCEVMTSRGKGWRAKDGDA